MKHTVEICWNKKSEERFLDNKYSRLHTWSFDGGTIVNASSSPLVVPLPQSSESAVDPEEAYIASLASCHMLFFLSIAASQKFIVERYEDRTEGILQKNDEGQLAITDVYLYPVVQFGGNNKPTPGQIAQVHEAAHKKCFLAASVKTTIHLTIQ